IALQNKYNIVFNLVFNDNTVIPSVENLNIFIENFNCFYKMGIRTITIPFLTWIKSIKKEFSELHIKNSVLIDVSTVSKFKEIASLGFDTISLSSVLVRNIDILKEIKFIRDLYYPNIKLLILVNEGCYGNCLYKNEHRMLTINNKKSNLVRGLYYCHIPNQNFSSIFKKASIIPLKREFNKFRKFIDIFKMTGRNSKVIFNNSIEEILNYKLGKQQLLSNFDIFGENIPHLFKILNKEEMINKWINKIENCGFNCYKCNYCDLILNTEESIFLQNYLDNRSFYDSTIHS
ncbi:hypothetical protein JXR93_06835, partial [bacterium]|nr:hypothetical protein [bacterium]